MKRLMENTVFSGLVTACRFATCPTNRSPAFVNPTTDGVSRPPSEFVMTTGSPPSITATTELVVPRSIPMILLMSLPPNLSASHYRKLSINMSILEPVACMGRGDGVETGQFSQVPLQIARPRSYGDWYEACYYFDRRLPDLRGLSWLST